MTRVFSFMMTSLDGYYQDSQQELGWNLIDDEFMEWNIRQNAEVSALMLGRKTFDHFEAFWTSDTAFDQMPDVARFMTAVPKIVVSHAELPTKWENTIVDNGDDLPHTIQRLRADAVGDVGVFGSSALTVSLLDQRLIDELRVIVNPVLLGNGFSLFAGLQERVALEPLAPTLFRSGNVLLRYRPITERSD